jgi:hypothetical protein
LFKGTLKATGSQIKVKEITTTITADPNEAVAQGSWVEEGTPGDNTLTAGETVDVTVVDSNIYAVGGVYVIEKNATTYTTMTVTSIPDGTSVIGTIGAAAAISDADDAISFGATTNTVASQYTLKIDGNEIQSIDSTDCDDADCTFAEDYTFDDVDVTIDENDTVSVEIFADIAAMGDIAEGDSLFAAVDADDIVAEDSSGDEIDLGDLTGTVTGEVQTFYSEGVHVTLTSISITKTYNRDAGTSGDADEATAYIKFNVKSFGSDAWIDKTAPDTTGGLTESDLDVTGSPTVAATITSSSGAEEGTNAFKVAEGDTNGEDFTVTVVITATTNEFVDVALTNILYALSDVDGNLSYTSNLDSFKTSPIYISITP